MYVRCPGCGKATRLAFGFHEPEMRCPGCGQRNSLRQAAALGATPAERYQKARDYSHAESIDLASAYSVLLGLLPLERARVSGGDPGSPVAVASGAMSASAASAESAKPAYDPGFREAVQDESLTAEEAVERGDRVAYATRIAHTHHVPMQDAFHVADNRMTVEEALAGKGRATRARTIVQDPPPPFPWRPWIAAVVGVVAIVSASVWVVQRASEAGGDASKEQAPRGSRVPVPVVDAAVEVRVDPSGRLTSVRAATPRDVLDLFCRSSHAGPEMVPDRVVPAEHGWTGLLRQHGKWLALGIRKVPQTQSWIAGNGRDPIRLEDGARFLAQPDQTAR